jgi:ribosome modulation factor
MQNEWFTPEYALGWNECLAGVDGRSCPYPAHTEEAGEWMAGWLDALEEADPVESLKHSRLPAPMPKEFVPYGPPRNAHN